MADNNIFFVNGVETSSAAEVQTALDQATSGISISVWNGDIAFSGDHTSAGAINLNVGGTSDGTYESGSTTNWCTEFQKDNTLSSTVTFNSDFKGTVAVFTGTNSENAAYSDSTAENANMRLIFDGAQVTGGTFYNFNYGYVEFKNGASFDNGNGTGHIRGDVLVTGEGTDVKIALERVYGDDFDASKIVTATLTVADGARFYDTVGDANVLNLGKTTSNRQGKIIINGGTFQSKCTIAPATYGTISISNSTVNGKTYYGKMLLDSTAGNPTLNFSGAAANALTISVNSADYADLKESYKIIELADPDSTLDMSKISVTVDGAAYTLGTTFADCYSINQVDNDLVLTYTPPPPLTVSANGGVFGKYATLGAAITAINDDSGTGPYTLEFNGDTTDGGSTVYIQKDVVFSGSATLDELALWFGDSGKTKVAHVLFSEGSEFVINNTGALNGRYLSDKSAASTMTVDNASVKVNEFSMNGPLVINGNGTGKADASGNIYGFLKNGTYQENFTSGGMTVLDLANANNGMGLQLTDYAWVKTNGSNYLTLKDDKPTTVSIENSRLDVAGYIKFNADGGIIQISGDSVFTAGQLGYGSGSVVSKTGSINVSGLDAEITVGKISSAVTAINFTLTAAEVGALTESYTLFELTDAAAAFDANTAISVMIDGASYKLNDRITINDSIFEVALGGTDANDLILTFVPPPPITVSLGNTEIGGYQKMSEALQVIKNVDTGNDGPYTITLNGTATETASGTKYIENDIVLTGKGTVNYNGECWFGNSSAINITVDEGDITFNSGVINGRHNGSSAASQLTISNGRLQHTGGYTTVNGTTRISGYGSTAVTDADGNVMYGYKLEDGSYVANFSTTKFHIADRYYENNGLALELKDFAYLHLGGADSAKGDTVIWKNEKGTTAAAQSFTAVVENSKLVAGNFEFNTAAHVLNVSGQSVISVLNFGFKDISDTTVCTGTATVNVTGMDSELSFGQISSAVTAINYTLKLADFASAGMIEAGDDVELLTLNNADAALDAGTVLTITIDGAAYTLGDEIVDDAGNKYVINMGDANGDSAANDLLVTLTEKAPEPVVPEGPGSEGESGGASTEPSQKVYINPYYSKDTLAYFSDVVGEELVLGKNAFTSIAAAKKALGANADIEYCTSAWNSSFSGSSQLEGIAKISNNSGSMGFNYGNFVSRYMLSSRSS